MVGAGMTNRAAGMAWVRCGLGEQAARIHSDPYPN